MSTHLLRDVQPAGAVARTMTGLASERLFTLRKLRVAVFG